LQYREYIAIKVPKPGEKLLDTACKNNFEFLQYYCSMLDEKIGYFKAKGGKKK
jgi:hypothetical protein